MKKKDWFRPQRKMRATTNLVDRNYFILNCNYQLPRMMFGLCIYIIGLHRHFITCGRDSGEESN